MLAELLEQDHRQQAGTGPAARHDVERRRRLGDALAVPARELLAHVLDHLPLARDDLQRLGDVLAELGQPRRAAAGAGCRSGHDDPLARQMLGERLARRALAREGRDRRGPGRPPARPRARPRVAEASSSSSCSSICSSSRAAALRARPVKLAPQLLDLQLQMRDQGLGVRDLGFDRRSFGLQPRWRSPRP